MRLEVRNEWIRRLESGEYRQATGQLVKPGDSGEMAFCCLGVLCAIAAEEGIVDLVESESEYLYGYADESGITETILPIQVSQWADLPYEEGVNDSQNPNLVDADREVHDAARWNDVERLPFRAIAQLIRYTFPEEECT